MSAQGYYNQHPNQGAHYRGQPQNFNSHGPQQQQMNAQGEKGVFSTLVGAGVGGYAGSKLTNHSSMGKIGGALIGGYALRHGIPGLSNHSHHNSHHNSHHGGFGGHHGGHHGGNHGGFGGPGGPGSFGGPGRW